MKGNYVAKHMHTVNRDSVHKSLSDYSRDYSAELAEGLLEYQFETQTKQKDIDESYIEKGINLND